MNIFKIPVSKLCVTALATTLLMAAPQIAQAQPDPNNVPKGDNPNNRPVRPNPRDMTPEQREAMMDRIMRIQLERMGLTDAEQQEAAIEYIQDEMDARQDLQESSRTLGTALRNQTLTDAQVAGLLNTYMVAVEDDRARRKAAQKKLGETIEMTMFPRLETLLTLMGAWGDAPNMMGNGGFARRPRTREDRRDNEREDRRDERRNTPREDKPEKAEKKEKKARADA